MAVIGKIGLTPKGEYNSETIYEILDVVSNNGNSYVSRIAENNQPLSNTEAWMLSAEKGGEGDKGDTFTFDDLTTAQKEELKGDVIAYNSLTEADKNDLASRVPVNGVIEEGNTQAVSGGEVYDAVPKVKFLSLIDKNSNYIKYDTVIASNGNWATNSTLYAGAVSIVDFPLEPNTTYSLGGFNANVGKTFALSNGTNDPQQISNLASLPKTFTTTATHYYLRVYIKQRDVEEPTSNWQNTLMLVKGSVLPSADLVTEINSKKIEAVKLSENNQVPNPINPQNAVNKGFFDSNAIKNSDLDIDYTDNLANQNNIILDKYIGNTGTIANGVGWRMIEIDVSSFADGTKFTFGNFIIQEGGYSSFYNNTTFLQNNGSYSNGTLPRTVTKPTGANKLYIDISRPTGVNNYNELTVNVGEVLNPYQPYAKLKGIKGLPIESTGGGGEYYDQSLNTTDNVRFASVETSSIETSVLLADLPIGISSVISGRWYLEDMGAYYEPRIKK